MTNRKTNKTIIFGIGFFADQIFRYCMMEGIQVVAFTVEKEYYGAESFHGLPVIPFEDLEKTYSKDSFSILICVSYNNMNQDREKVFKKIKEKGYTISSFIHPTATILADSLGEGNIILENASIGIGCRIGDGNIFYNNTVISHDTVIQNYNFFAPSSTVLGGVKINNGCFFGGNSTIKNYITIDDYCLVGANAFVRNSTNKNEVIVPTKSVSLNAESMYFVDKLM